ncbi:hypothetical protein I7X12_10070 [Halosimplex litoreum]|uniref:Uncharacterized protein n=1 Tax=Halosimplex litoreum TaxID=1198301 RepID=A0A7U3WBC7_9EURY|nr:hypothetical protein [Halosimplex litoreum]QPV64922.1 hypothetical protein I7X12_10070 [Halosimplex litoreum]
MIRKPTVSLDTDLAEQLAGLAGLGWTTSTLGFLGTVLGYGNSVVSRLVTEPSSLLYVGAVCFLATVGLDRVANGARERDGEGESDAADDIDGRGDPAVDAAVTPCEG